MNSTSYTQRTYMRYCIEKLYDHKNQESVEQLRNDVMCNK